MIEDHDPILSFENCLTLPQAVAILPKIAGVAVCRTTLWRWATHGVNGVTLETFILGRRLITSQQALLRFLSRLECDIRAQASNS